MSRAASRRYSDATVNKWWRAYACAEHVELDLDDQHVFTESVEEVRRLFGLFAGDVDSLREALRAPSLVGGEVATLSTWIDGDELVSLLGLMRQLADAVRWGSRGASVRYLRRVARDELRRFRREDVTAEQIVAAINAALVAGGVK